MKKFATALAIFGMAVSASACATLTRGSTQPFVIESSPPGAAVKTSNGFTCPATPCTFSMQRKEAFSVTISKDGYVPHIAEVKSEFAGNGAAGFAGNILVGGLIGMGVDATSGALNDLTPNPLKVVLEPAPTPAATPAAVTPDVKPEPVS